MPSTEILSVKRQTWCDMVDDGTTVVASGQAYLTFWTRGGSGSEVMPILFSLKS